MVPDSVLLNLECGRVLACVLLGTKFTSKSSIHWKEPKKTLPCLPSRHPATASLFIRRAPMRRARKTRTGFHVQAASIIHGIFNASRPLQFVTVSDLRDGPLAFPTCFQPAATPPKLLSSLIYCCTLSEAFPVSQREIPSSERATTGLTTADRVPVVLKSKNSTQHLAKVPHLYQ